MDTGIRFESKEECNARREREFLALSPAERVMWFLRSFNDRNGAPKEHEDTSGNFIIRKRDDAVR